MDLVDALTITGLGISVVFTGLLLTALLIILFSVVPQLVQRLRAPAPASPGPTAPAASEGSTATVDPEVLSVIVTVLEAEHRLHFAGRGRQQSTAANGS